MSFLLQFILLTDSLEYFWANQVLIVQFLVRFGRHGFNPLYTSVAGLLLCPPPPPFTVDFCSYQASISVEKASAKLSLLPLWLVDPTGFSLAIAGTAVTVPLAGEGLAGSSGGTDSLLVEDL